MPKSSATAIEEFPEIEEFPDTSSSSWPRGLTAIGISPLVQATRLPERLAASPFDLLGLRERILKDPNIETNLSVLGATAGPLAGIAFPPLAAIPGALPALSGIGAGLGGAIGKTIELGREGPHLPEGSQSQIATSAGLNAIFGFLGGKPIAEAGEKAAAFNLSKATPEVRLPLVERIRSALTGAPARSGEQLGETLSKLQATHPERQQLLGQHFGTALENVRNLLSGTQGASFQNALMKSAEDLGHTDLIKGLLPELEIGMGSLEGQAGQVRRADISTFRRQIINQLRSEGRLPPEIRPEGLTLDQVQRFKQTLGDIFRKKLDKFGARLTKTELDAFEAYNSVKSAELASHPELQEEFLRHKKLMDQFRQVKDVLADPDALEGALRSRFGRGSASQVAVKGLLEDRPEDMLLVRRFAKAEEFEKAQSMLARSALRYGLLFPLYSLASIVRHEIFREMRKK